MDGSSAAAFPKEFHWDLICIYMYVLKSICHGICGHSMGLLLALLAL